MAEIKIDTVGSSMRPNKITYVSSRDLASMALEAWCRSQQGEYIRPEDWDHVHLEENAYAMPFGAPIKHTTGMPYSGMEIVGAVPLAVTGGVHHQFGCPHNASVSMEYDDPNPSKTVILAGVIMVLKYLDGAYMDLDYRMEWMCAVEGFDLSRKTQDVSGIYRLHDQLASIAAEEGMPIPDV